MKNFFSQTTYTEADINNLISTAAEESINLDFKASGSLDQNDGKKNDISKDVASFANSDGGIIIYGINEVNHKADSLSFIDGNIYTKEWLEQVINSRIQKRIPNFIIYPIRFNNAINQTVYVVKIEQSAHAPHISSDKKFYKRYNFQSVPMEEYEVRDSFNRKIKTELEIGDLIITGGAGSLAGGLLREAEYGLNFQVRNIGNSIEERYKLEITLPKAPYHNAHSDINQIKKYFIRNEGDCSIFSVPNSSPLFQEELTTVVSVYIRTGLRDYQLLENPGVKVKLYYSNGIKEREFKLLDSLAFQGKLIKDWTWAM